MSRPVLRSTPTVAILFAAVPTLIAYSVSASAVFALVVLVVLSVAGALAADLIRRRPERTVLVLAAVVLGLGAVGTTVEVVRGAGGHGIESHGRLNAKEIRRQADPRLGRSTTARLEDRRIGYLAHADGTTRTYRVTDGQVVGWAVGEYAPWALAILAFALAVPLLRAADRGDPFLPGAASRLSSLGIVLLVGIPLVRLVQWFAAEVVSPGESVGPIAEPVLSLGLTDLLPGVLVLVLASVFRRGFVLRDLEQHTV